MVCERTRAYVSLEVDGELSEFERGFLTSHLRGCSDCSGYRAEIHALAKHIRDAPPEVPTLGVRFPVPVSSRPTARLARLQLGAAAALAIAVVGTATLLTPNVDRRKPATPDGQETLPARLNQPNTHFSRGQFRGHPTPGSSAPAGTGNSFII